MIRTSLIAVLMTGLVACTGGGSTETDATLGPDAYPSDFTRGKHRATALALRAQDDGVDFDGDGAGDNNLPFVLETADQILSDQDLAPESFDAQIETAIADGSLNVLFDSAYAEGTLQIALLNGLGSEAGDTDSPAVELTIDPTSLDGSGAPITVLSGEFQDQTAFSVGADRAVLIVPFVPGEPPSSVPMERVTLTGTLDGEVMTATMTGIIPAQELADDVLADMIPEEGIGNLSKETLLKTVRRLAELETMADIDMGDGRRGVSCAFNVEAAAATWVE